MGLTSMVDNNSNQDYLKSKTQNRGKDEASRVDATPSSNILTVSKADVKSEFKCFIDKFKDFERSNGASRGTAQQHADMIVYCIAVLKKFRRRIRFECVTAKDLDRILKVLEDGNVKHSGSYVRVFAVFLSFITGSEPIIDTGRYGIMAGNRFMLMSRPDDSGERRREGTPEEKADIEQRYGEELDAFTEYELSFNVNPLTAVAHRKHLDSCIFVLEKRYRSVNFMEITLDDIGYLRTYLEDFGIDDVDRSVNLFVKFIAHFTGNEPLLKQKYSIYSKATWSPSFKKDFRFGKEMERYVEMLLAKGYTQNTIGLKRFRIVTCCGLIESTHSGFKLRDVDSSMLEAVRAELEKVYSVNKSASFISSMSDFIGYITGRYLSETTENRTEYHIVLDPKTESDSEFIDRLSEYIGFMVKWGYKDHTIKGRISANTVCYRKLKEIKGDFHLEEITAMDIRQLRDSYMGYAEGTIRQSLYAFGWFLDHATGYNPCEDAKLMFNSGTETRQFIFNEDWMKLYENADVMGRLILSLGATMGLRRKEILALRMEDIIDGKLRIHGKGTGVNGKVVIMEMSELVKKDLDDYLIVRSQILSIVGDRTGGILLINMTKKYLGKSLQVRSFDTFLDNLQEKSGISFTSHCLRRFFCTTMNDAGVDLDTIRRMMRHSSLETTLKCYMHADPRKMSEAVSKINNVFATISN